MRRQEQKCTYLQGGVVCGHAGTVVLVQGGCAGCGKALLGAGSALARGVGLWERTRLKGEKGSVSRVSRAGRIPTGCGSHPKRVWDPSPFRLRPSGLSPWTSATTGSRLWTGPGEVAGTQWRAGQHRQRTEHPSRGQVQARTPALRAWRRGILAKMALV